MVFSSLIFLFQFMPLFFLFYFLVPKRFKNLLLFLASLFFYGWGEPRFLVLILVSIFVNYTIGRAIEYYELQERKRRTLLIGSIVYNIGMLVFFKYTNFFIESINQIFHGNMKVLSIILPLGISFYTFQIMSYTIDVYWRKTKAETSFINLGAYLCMFPQLIAGPIVVYSQVSERLKQRTIKCRDIEEGLKIFILGLGSKVLLANNIGALWKEIEEIGFVHLSMPLAWMGIIAFALQIYFDFNGYSLMAIGLGKIMGFDFPKNFDFPYISRSITEFWRRWHITLSSWFRDYLYIPLGGNRKGKGHTYLNLFIVWSATGLWHGAGWNFVLWGMYFFILLSLEKIFIKDWLNKHKVVSRIYFIIGILISWLIFEVSSLKEIFVYIGRMFSFSFSQQWLYYLRNYGVIILIGIFLSTPVLRQWYNKVKSKGIGIMLLLGTFLLSIAYLVDAAYNPFLYFRF